jgi:ferritin
MDLGLAKSMSQGSLTSYRRIPSSAEPIEVTTMIGAEFEAALNTQLNRELFSSYLYLSMSAWFERIGLKGHAHWMRLQAQEEKDHADKILDYLLMRDGVVLFAGIDAPDQEWDSSLSAFEATYKHEQFVTQSINELMDVALKHSDHAGIAFLQWFVSEQVEEEATVSEIVGRLKLVEGDGRGLLMIDQELAARVYTPPPA